MSNLLSLAVLKLKPNSEFVIENEDYSTIKWITLDGEAPTQSEVESALEVVKEEKVQEANKIAAAKAAAEAKLAALGLTADDLKALGLGGN